MFLTTQYLEEAEQLADRIAILHEGRIISSGTLAELQSLFPPAKAEYVEKQPTLEEIFLTIIGKKEGGVAWNRQGGIPSAIWASCSGAPCVTFFAAWTPS